MLNEKTVERAGECRLPTEFGEFRLVAFRAKTDGRIHYALVAGEIHSDAPTLIRVHVHDSLYDLTASSRRDAGWPVGDCASQGRRGRVRDRRRPPAPGAPERDSRAHRVLPQGGCWRGAPDSRCENGSPDLRARSADTRRPRGAQDARIERAEANARDFRLRAGSRRVRRRNTRAIQPLTWTNRIEPLARAAAHTGRGASPRTWESADLPGSTPGFFRHGALRHFPFAVRHRRCANRDCRGAVQRRGRVATARGCARHPGTARTGPRRGARRQGPRRIRDSDRRRLDRTPRRCRRRRRPRCRDPGRHPPLRLRVHGGRARHPDGLDEDRRPRGLRRFSPATTRLRPMHAPAAIMATRVAKQRWRPWRWSRSDAGSAPDPARLALAPRNLTDEPTFSTQTCARRVRGCNGYDASGRIAPGRGAEHALSIRACHGQMPCPRGRAANFGPVHTIAPFFTVIPANAGIQWTHRIM